MKNIHIFKAKILHANWQYRSVVFTKIDFKFDYKFD